MARILVTYGWCRTAYVAVKALASDGHEVYTCSHLTPSMSGISRFTKGSAKTPDHTRSAEEFTKAVGALAEKWRIDLILPGHEDALILRKHSEFLPKSVCLACPCLKQLEVGLDKLETTVRAEVAGVPVPKTLKAEPDKIEKACASIGYPVMIKLAHSNSAKGIFPALTEPELLELMQSGRLSQTDASDLYVQKFHRGPVVGSCFLSESGKIRFEFQEKYRRTKNEGMGTSVYREPYTSPQLSEWVRRLVKELDWTGIGHFDFIRDEVTGEYVLLEMNPRPWGAINLALVNGFDFISAWVDVCMGTKNIERHFNPFASPKNSLWLVGECIRMVELMKKRKIRQSFRVPFEILGSVGRTSYDDFIWNDPLPLFAESICYAKGFLFSGGNTNPG